MKLYVGTSGFGYRAWKGKFYPSDLQPADMLRYYGEHFRGVEMNNTFMRMPAPSVMKGWTTQVPRHFKFAIKAPRQITHARRLLNANEPLRRLLKTTAFLKDRLGPLLFQLPPNFKADVPRLRDFLGLLPRRPRIAFEFRHPSWFDDDVFSLLRKHRAALCIADTDEDDVRVPFVATTDFGYLRLRRTTYRKPQLARWAEQIQAEKWRETFVFFKHEDEARGPRFAQILWQLMA